MRLIPNDERDFAYTVAAFRCQAGGSLRVRLADDTIRTLAVVAGQWVDLPVRRIYRTGTTAWGFVSGDGDYCIPYASTGTLPPPLLTFPAPYSLYRLDGDGLHVHELSSGTLPAPKLRILRASHKASFERP